MVKVGVVIPVRDGEDVIGITLKSLMNQNGIDIYISVGNDHSIDNTRKIINECIEESNNLENVSIRCFDYPRRDARNYSKVPILLNIAMKYLPECEYYMVSGDDMAYPTYYVEQVIKHMRFYKTDIASGFSIEYGYSARSNAPSGSGRIFTKRIWQKVTPFLSNIAWESGCLYHGVMYGIKLGFYPVPKSHLHEQEIRSTITWGHAGYILKTPLLFVVFRIIRMFIKRSMPFRLSMSILVGQIQYMILKPDYSSGDIGDFNKSLKVRQIKDQFANQFFKKNPITQFIIYPMYLRITGKKDRRNTYEDY
jgi:glycosyltransferase involved in cell wall biosynthesis